MQQRDSSWSGSTPGEDATAAGVRAASAAIGDPAPKRAGAFFVPPAASGIVSAVGEAEAFHKRWTRVVVKLSGEAFAGNEPLGISPDAVAHIAAEVVSAVAEGVEVAAVVGGGNMFRGVALSERGIDRARADYMGMLGTVINCLALQ